MVNMATVLQEQGELGRALELYTLLAAEALADLGE